ncbi:MAG: ABC transporter permease [Acidobacteriota bacterium]|nr:ABC transporter permease [Blastocatellia bacterium]MDW8240204.1 ABC transporter permease [Acidobacteriota bacterium]
MIRPVAVLTERTFGSSSSRFRWLRSTLLMARLTLHEARRRKILWAAFGLGSVLLTLYGVGLFYIVKESLTHDLSPIRRNQTYNIIAVMGLYAVNYLTVLMTILISVDTLAGEIATGTIQSIATKPIRRLEIVLGKWIGFASLLSLYLLFMAGGILILTYAQTGFIPRHVLRGLALVQLESLLLLSVTFLWGTMFSTLTTGVLTLGLQGVAFIGGWIEQYGVIENNQTVTKVGLLASLIMPSESLWRRAAFEWQSAIINATGYSPFSGVSVPSDAMVVYAGVYLLIALGLAIHQFAHRDL